MSPPLGAFRVAYAIFLFGLFAYFLPPSTWNPTTRFDLTRAIVEEHRLSIDSTVEDTGDRAFAGGHWYSDKAPIPSLLAVPFYAVFLEFEHARGDHPQFVAASTPDLPAQHVSANASFVRGLYVCSLATAGVAATAIGLLLFELLRRRTTLVGALVGSSLTVLGTPIFPYATSFYGHVVAGAFLLAAFVVTRDAPSRARMRIAGACLPLAVGCEYIVAVPALVIALFVLAERPRPERARAVVDLAIGALLPIVIVGAYHTACFGAPFRTGYSFVVRPEFAAGHARGLLGVNAPRPLPLAALLFGRFRGLCFVAPIALVALVAMVVRIVRMARAREDREVIACGVTFLALLAVNAGYYMWWGGAAAGPRHLVPVVPFLAVGLAAAWKHERARPLVVLVGVVSIVNMLVLAGVGLEAPEHGDVLFDYAYPELFAGRIARLGGASNLGLRLGLVRGGTLGPPLAWLILGAGVLVRALRGSAAEEPKTSVADAG